MKLKDKIAIVTGGSRGIGRAIALEQAKENADTIFTFMIDKSRRICYICYCYKCYN